MKVKIGQEYFKHANPQDKVLVVEIDSTISIVRFRDTHTYVSSSMFEAPFLFYYRLDEQSEADQTNEATLDSVLEKLAYLTKLLKQLKETNK